MHATGLLSKQNDIMSKFVTNLPIETLDTEMMLEKSINRAMKIEDFHTKNSSLGMNLNVFDHKNVYYSTRINP